MPGAARRELVTIERRVTESDAYGGRRQDWVKLAETWARVTWVRGGEAERQGALREIAVYRFTMLAAHVADMGLTVSDRIVWNGETYNIRERPRRQTRGVEIDVIAETGVTQ